jgi:hypothetical protein
MFEWGRIAICDKQVEISSSVGSASPVRIQKLLHFFDG